MPLVLGLGALVLASMVAVLSQRTVTPRFTLSAGVTGTTRAHVAAALVDVAKLHGADAKLVTLPDVADELTEVNEGRIDFALISGAYHLGPHENVREVGGLYLEALHLLVKDDLADDVAHDLGALRGHSVDLGPKGSETDGMARMVLAFAQLVGPADAGPRLELSNLEYDQLRALSEAGDAAQLPDALFQLAIVPSELALPLVRDHDYRLVALPFADAMRLNALTADISGAEHEVDWQYLTDVIVPPLRTRCGRRCPRARCRRSAAGCCWWPTSMFQPRPWSWYWKRYFARASRASPTRRSIRRC